MFREIGKRSVRATALLSACLAAGLALSAGAAMAQQQDAPVLEKGPGDCPDSMHVGGRTITLKASDVIEQPLDLRRLELQPGEYVLTFDDGPTWVTYFITETLAQHCAKGVFFMVGSRALENQDVIARVVAGGHEIGNNTMDNKALGKLPLAEARAQIEEGRKAIRSLVGEEYPVLMVRPPSFDVNDGVHEEIARLGMVEIGSDLTPQDWRGDAAEASMERMLDQLAKSDRGVILLHDNQPNTRGLVELLMAHFAETGKKAVLLKVVP